MQLQPLTATEMQSFESYACDNFDITVDDMMQNAGQAIFDLIMNELLPPESDIGQCRFQEEGQVLIIIGKGNNGGDALVAARLLHKSNIKVAVLSPYLIDEFTEAARQELDKIKKLNILIIKNIDKINLNEYSLIIDGLFGFRLKGNPRPPADKIIEQINCSKIPILAVDVPSGLDVETGQIMQPAINPTYIITLGMPKVGFDYYHKIVGKIYLGNLGIPEKAYQKLGYYTPIFIGKSYIVLD